MTTLDLARFTGTEVWYRHGLVPKITFTEGVKYVADTAGAYWLLDLIAIAQLPDPENKDVRQEEFQVWKLEVAPNHAATLTCEDGNKNVVRTTQIPFTDFPEEGITLWFTDNVILLPSEY